MTPHPQLDKQKIIDIFEELDKDEYRYVDPLEVRISTYLHDIKDGSYDVDCPPHSSAKSEQEIREKVMDEKFWQIRNVINFDHSGLAETANKMMVVAKGYSWIPEGEWGSYDYTERTVETLQKEIGFLLEELEKIGTTGLKKSDARVRAYIQSVEAELRSKQGGEQR